ncbi:MAG: hypothetical protein PHP00_14860 [Thiotrichaceae bacterium]|nr:hypothetical protein [Thiotrichaceae bacterium]
MSLTDIQILKDMFIDNVVSSDIKETTEGNELELSEPNQPEYKVVIKKVPDQGSLIVIKTDKFEAPKSLFRGSRDECKRADFMLIDTEKMYVTFVEMKSGKNEKEAIAQLRGAQCLFIYCREIGRVFWEQTSFLENYEHRFVIIKEIKTSIKLRSSTVNSANGKRGKQTSTNQHGKPDQPLKIKSHLVHYGYLLYEN